MVSIIGAGPVGNYLAAKLAKKGLKVDVYEEHKKIGAPVACTGILTPYIKDLMKIDENYIVNKITETYVYSPDGNQVKIKLKKNYIVDRTLFDSALAKIAKSEGAKYHLGKRLTSLKLGKQHKLKFGKDIVKDSTVVGADGPNTLVGRSAGLFENRKFVAGHQARVKLKEKIDSNVVEFFLDEGNYIGWLVPETNKIARIGVASHKNVNKYFNDLMKRREGKILGWQSGAIPVYDHKANIENNGVYLIGDAATQVKATTYGGIIPGMKAADVLTEVISENKSEGCYQKGVKNTIGKNLWSHLMIRKVMNRFSKEDYNKLIKLCEKKSVKDLIYKYDREYASKLMFKLLINQPKFASFAKCLFRKEII